MISSTIIFKLPLHSDWLAIRKRAKQRAGEYFINVKGLVEKEFILNEDSGEYGGIYRWEDKKYLDNFLQSDAFKSSVEKLGQPEIKIFEIIVSIKNGKVITS